MKIVSLQAENIKRLVAVEINPDGNLVQITGKNGQGKTSVLDAIWWALAGTSNIQDVPIRKGQTQAKIRLDLGEIVVTRTFKATEGGEFTTSISVENADGARFPSPQTMLDGLLGKLTFDPLAFARMDAKQQLVALRRLVPGVDFDAMDRDDHADYASRTDANRKAKELRTRAEAIRVPSGIPSERVDTADLRKRIAESGEKNSVISAKANRRESLKGLIEQLREQARSLREKLAEIESRGKTLVAELQSLPPIEDPIDSAALVAELERADAVNAAIAQREQREQLERSAAEEEAKSAKLTARMAERRKSAEQAMASAKFPISGIAFGDGCVTLNGIPLKQASDAEQLRVSMAIAMAGSERLRIARVRDGSLLDEASLSLVAEMADEMDCQVWIERVDSSGKVGFVIEDGRVKEGQSK